MEHATAFGHEVRDLRRALDLTQDELARRVGCAAHACSSRRTRFHSICWTARQALIR